MEFTPHMPTATWSSNIASIFHMRHFMPGHSVERVVPTGHVYLIFALDGVTRRTFHVETLEPLATYTKCWVSGAHRNHIAISAHPDSEMLVVQFAPHGARPFFHRDIASLTEQVTDGAEVLGPDVDALWSQLNQPTAAAEKFAAVDAWLGARFDEKQTAPAALVKTLNELMSAPASRFQEVVADHPHSPKHLGDQFKKYVGLTPKYFHRIQRFQHIIGRVQRQETITWTDIALDSGLSDQSHFIREFRHFSGFSPEQFRALGFQPEQVNFFALDKAAAD